MSNPSIIGTLPSQLLNGTVADATQVMADLNYIVNQINNNVPLLYAPLASPTFTGDASFANIIGTVGMNGVTLTGAVAVTGNWTVPTQPAASNNTKIANTAYVDNAVAGATGGSYRVTPVRNPTCEISDGSSAVTLTSSYVGGPVLWALGRVSGTLLAGTFGQGTVAGLGAASKQAAMLGVTGDGTSGMDFCMRVSAADAEHFVNQTMCASAWVKHDVGSNVDVEVSFSKANARNDFSTVTLIGAATTTAVATGTATQVKCENIALGDVTNGFQINVVFKPAGSFTTKNFYATDFNVNVGTTVAALIAPLYPSARNGVYETASGIYTDSGTANALVVTTDDYVPFLFDGLCLSVLLANAITGTAPTVNINGLGAKTIVTNGTLAVLPNGLPAGYEARLCYHRATDKFMLINPLFATPAPTIQKLTSGSGNWTVPANVYRVKARLIGGGGGGGSYNGGGGGGTGGGGGGGGYGEFYVATTPGATIAYAVGAAGTATLSLSGTAGGSTSFGSHSAAGGAGGVRGNAGGAGGAGGAGDTASDALGIAGVAGTAGAATGGIGGIAGGLAGTTYGKGGDGGTLTAGTAGTAGVIILEY